MMLANQIMPLIVSAVYRGAVKPVGHEDKDDLISEATVIAANNLESCEHRGKTVSPNSLAFYAVQTLKTGRRACGGSRGDVMSPAAALSGMTRLRSMDESVGVDEDDPSGELTLHDCIASPVEDADVAAARELDWEPVVAGMDERRRGILMATADGTGTAELAQEYGVTAPRICQLRESIGEYIVNAWGDNGLANVTTPSKWRAGLRAGVERRAGRYERAWRP